MGEIAVLFGGPSPEHDVSILTGLQAAHELLAQGRATRAIYWTKLGGFVDVDPSLEASSFLEGAPKGATPLTLTVGDGGGFIPEGGRLRAAKPLALDVVILCTHGGPGEDGTLQAALDLAGIAYTGPSLAGAALGMDKLAFGAVMIASQIPTLPRVALTASLEEVGFDGPYIIKPRFGGSSIGIDVVTDLVAAKARLGSNPHLAQGAVLEPYRADLADLQVAVRTYPDLELSAIERPLRSGEINTIPGSLARYLFIEPLVPFSQLLDDLVAEATARPTRRYSAAGADGLVLRGAATIAAKLA